MGLLVQNAQIVPAYIPVDINGNAQLGDLVSLQHFNHFTFIGISNDGVGAITYTLLEARDAAGTGQQVLAVIDNYWEKTGAANLLAAGAFVRTDRGGVPLSTVVATANQPSVIVFEVDGDRLTNGFSYLRVNATESMAAACLVAAFYVLSSARYSQDILATVIA